MSNWILSVSASLWLVIEECGAYASRTRVETDRIKKKDRIIFYVGGTRQFHGTFEASSGWHEPGDAWPHHVTDEISLAAIRRGTVGIRSVARSLQFVKRSRWVGLHLHNGLANYGRAITDGDYDVISGRMMVNARLGAN